MERKFDQDAPRPRVNWLKLQQLMSETQELTRSRITRRCVPRYRLESVAEKQKAYNGVAILQNTRSSMIEKLILPRDKAGTSRRVI